MLTRVGKQQERMWCEYCQVRSSESFVETWVLFLKTAGCEASPIICQYVTDFLMKQLIKLRYHLATVESNDKDVSLDYQESNAVRYATGYTIGALMKKVNWSKHKQKVELTKCLQKMTENSEGVHDSIEWTKAADRGSLIHVDDMIYGVFVKIELVI